MEYEAREYERNYRSRTSKTQEDIEPVDFITPVIIVQFISLFIVFAMLFCFYKTDKSLFNKFRVFYNNVMEQDLTAKELAENVKSVFGFLSEFSEPTGNNNQENDEGLNAAGGEDLLYPNESASFSPVILSSQMVIPLEYKRITSTFGYRINPVTGKYGFHAGTDLSADKGTAIKAAFDGKIIKATKSEVRGNYIFLESGNITTVYCHCSELLVKEGDIVRAGDIIAKVGATGEATGPHLHFELRINGIHYNPEWLFKAE